jgi:hypothetical protein
MLAEEQKQLHSGEKGKNPPKQFVPTPTNMSAFSKFGYNKNKFANSSKSSQKHLT